MKRADRARLLVKIVEQLAQEEFPTIDLVIGQFDGKRSEHWDGGKAAYVAWGLEAIPDNMLEELGDYLGLTVSGLHSSLGAFGVDGSKIWGDSPQLRLFLSHISANKEGASRLKQLLADVGVSCFVAHADIQPTKEWIEEILHALRSMDALAALLVPDFHASNWTDQEVGFAIARGVPIISLQNKQVPYGFIGRYQGLNCANSKPEQVASAVARLLIENSQSSAAMINAVSRRLVGSKSHVQTSLLLDLLEFPSAIPHSALEHVKKALAENGQVSGAPKAEERIGALFKKHAFSVPKPPSKWDDEIPF